MNKEYRSKYEYGVWRDAWVFAGYAVAILSILSHNNLVARVAALASMPYKGLGLPEWILMIAIGMLIALGQIELFKHGYTKISVENDSLVLFKFPHRRTSLWYGDLSLHGSLLEANGKTLLDLRHFQGEEDLSSMLSGLVVRKEDSAGGKEPEPARRRDWKRWALSLLLAAAVILLIYGLIKLPELLSHNPFLWIFDGLLGAFILFKLWKLIRPE